LSIPGRPDRSVSDGRPTVDLPAPKEDVMRKIIVAEFISLDGVVEAPGADILVTGSISLVRTLLRAGLVDDLQLLVHPILVGAGERLFPAPAPGPRSRSSAARCSAAA
jgi:dihydrofolate reductase